VPYGNDQAKALLDQKKPAEAKAIYKKLLVTTRHTTSCTWPSRSAWTVKATSPKAATRSRPSRRRTRPISGSRCSWHRVRQGPEGRRGLGDLLEARLRTDHRSAGHQRARVLLPEGRQARRGLQVLQPGVTHFRRTRSATSTAALRRARLPRLSRRPRSPTSRCC